MMSLAMEEGSMGAVGRYGFAACLLGLAAGWLTVSASAQPPACFGKLATIVATPDQPTVGTDGVDVIVGTPGDDHIRGGAGDDFICGLGGADLIAGNGGRDKIRGGAGPDQIRGGKGHDAIWGGSGNDKLHGNSGNDIIRGKRGTDRIWGGKGNDTIRGGAHDDTIFGNRGNDHLNGGLGTDRCIGAARTDASRACEIVDVSDHADTGVGVVGVLESVRAVQGGTELAGWALYPSGTTSRPWLEVTADGELFATFLPTSARPDIQQAYGSSANRAGFRVNVELPADAHTVCIDMVADSSNARVRLGCGVSNPQAAAAESASLDALLTKLGKAAERKLEGTTVALAVVPFHTGESALYRGGRLFVSASAAKSWWTAAALANGNATEAAALASALFGLSSDTAAGTMIDLAGGIDAVNDFTLDAGMTDTAAIRWSTGNIARSAEFPGRLNGSNHVDAGDAAKFFYKLGTYQVLNLELTDLLAGWMRLSPRDARTGSREASTISDSLPHAVKEATEHKAGWLPSGAFSVPAHLLGVGIVHPTNGGPSYAVALMGSGGDTAAYTRLIEFFQSASCQVYVHVASDQDWACPDW